MKREEVLKEGRKTVTTTVVRKKDTCERTFNYCRQAFLKEAQTVAQIDHPRVVRVLDYFELNNTAYLVMVYYEGEDLARHLRLNQKDQLQMPWQKAVTLLLPVLDGLQKVHEAGFMHRDINPRNIYLTKEGPILLDFGAARQVDANHLLSQCIESKGYSPFEQSSEIAFNRQGPWTDVYAFAATLYVMLTAKDLPESKDRYIAQQNKQPDCMKPVRSFAPDVPLALEQVLNLALAIEPEQRLQSVAEFKRALENLLATNREPPPAPHPTTPALRRAATLSDFIIIIAIIGFMAFLFRLVPWPDDPPVSPPVVAPFSSPDPPTLRLDRSYLTVATTPATAQIRIINISSPYQHGIELVPGDFDLEVTAPGYQTYLGRHTLTAGVINLPIGLEVGNVASFSAATRSGGNPASVSAHRG